MTRHKKSDKVRTSEKTERTPRYVKTQVATRYLILLNLITTTSTLNILHLQLELFL